MHHFYDSYAFGQQWGGHVHSSPPYNDAPGYSNSNYTNNDPNNFILQIKIDQFIFKKSLKLQYLASKWHNATNL